MVWLWHSTAQANAMACPQPAEADIRPLDGNSGFDPLLTLAGPKSRTAASP